MDTTNQAPQKQITFNNNPFSLAFAAMSQAFKINQNPAIAIIVGGIIITIANQITQFMPNPINLAGPFIDENNEGAQLAVGVFSMVFGFGIMIVSIFVSTLWAGFLAHVGVQNAKGVQTTVNGGFKSALSKFWTIFAINFFIGLIGGLFIIPAIIVGIIGGVLMGLEQEGIAIGIFIAAGLLAIVGLFFAIRYSLARSLSLYAMYDENLGVFESMKRSATLTKGRVIEAWGMAIPGAIIPFIGGLLTNCGVGAHYLQLKVYRDHSVELPKVHILSWLGVFISLAIFIVIALFVLLLGALASTN